MQNQQPWTAGLISGKLRGVCAKFWARLQIFFKSGGLRVESTKVQGLFSKRYRPNRYGWISTAGSASGGSDLLWVRSNQGRSKRIGWPGLKGGDGGGAGRRETFPAAAPRRRGTKPVFWWPFCLGFGPGMITVTRVIPWSGKQGAAGFVAGCSAVGTARCGGASPASSAPAPRGRPRPKQLAQQG